MQSISMNLRRNDGSTVPSSGWLMRSENLKYFMAGFDVKRAALRGEWEAVTKYYRQWQGSVIDIPVTVTIRKDTLLHLCAQCDRSDIMRELLEVLPERAWRMKNVEGNTVLHEAVKAGSTDMTEIIVEKAEDLIWSRNMHGETPIYWAAMYGRKNLLLFLSLMGRVTISTSLRRNDGSTILHAAVLGKFYDVALEILELYPYLAWCRDEKGLMPSHILALSPSSFKSGTIYSYQYVGASPYFSPEKIVIGLYAFIPIENYETETVPAAHHSQKLCSFMQRCKHYFLSGIKWICLGCSVLKIIYAAKKKHTYAMQLMKYLIARDSQWNYSSDGRDPQRFYELQYISGSLIMRKTKVIERPLILATKMGIIEMVKEIIKICPESLEFLEEDTGNNVLHLAAEHRHEYILEFLKSMKRDLANMMVGIDREGNTVLHAAAKLVEDKPWHIRGAAHQMQWECIWFERVKAILPAHMITMQNYSNRTAKEVFTETHKDLVEKGERWLKEVSNTCMLMTTLIATVIFASAFTVPGGNNGETGLPVLLKESDFTLFIQYVAVTLCFSLLSLGSFLSIHTSRFNEEDFFAWLPLKVVLGLTLLFNSVVCTLAAFCQAYFLVTGWRFSDSVTAMDICLAVVGFFFFVYLYLDITLCFIRYLVDILFI